jgi:hypothetical protein
MSNEKCRGSFPSPSYFIVHLIQTHRISVPPQIQIFCASRYIVLAKTKGVCKGMGVSTYTHTTYMHTYIHMNWYTVASPYSNGKVILTATDAYARWQWVPKKSRPAAVARLLHSILRPRPLQIKVPSVYEYQAIFWEYAMLAAWHSVTSWFPDIRQRLQRMIGMLLVSVIGGDCQICPFTLGRLVACMQ